MLLSKSFSGNSNFVEQSSELLESKLDFFQYSANVTMKSSILTLIGIASFFYLLASESGSLQYFIAIAALLVCIFLYSSPAVTAVSCLGFIAWHFTDFSSELWFEFLFLPLVASACLIRAFFAIPLLQALFRTAPIRTHKNKIDDYFDN